MKKGYKTFIIAEAGVNHNGNLNMALKLVDAAKESGANAVKFQSFKAKKIVSINVPKAKYQSNNIGNSLSQFEMLKSLELSEDDHFAIAEHCRLRDIQFMSTPFDFDHVDLLVSLGVKCFKIGSGDITNAPLLLKIAQKQLPIILSTGMSSLQDIEAALGVISYGYLNSNPFPGEEQFTLTYHSHEAKTILKDKVSLLHCTTEYPAPLSEVNLSAMKTMSQYFGLKVGLSDHTLGITIAIGAVALGASIIEKHITLDKGLEGPDHKASLTPKELSMMVNGIRQIEEALGSSEKAVTHSELQNITLVRRSIVADTNIKEGEIFSSDNLAIKRPGSGISPFKYWDLIGQRSTKNYEPDELIEV